MLLKEVRGLKWEAEGQIAIPRVKKVYSWKGLQKTSFHIFRKLLQQFCSMNAANPYKSYMVYILSIVAGIKHDEPPEAPL